MRVLVACALFALVACQVTEPVPPADLIVHNAVVYTVNDAQPRAEAVAVRGGRFVVVGSNAEALKLRGPNTRVVDGGGRTMLPGLQDAHGHFTDLGESLQVLKLRGTTSFDQIVEMVRARAAAARPGEWILGRSWDQNDWADKNWPTHDKLTAAAPNNPVYLTRVDGHAALVNKAAIDAAGLTRATRDPDGGRLIRDAGGTPSGVLIDSAQGLVSSKIPDVSDAQLDEQILLADAETRRLGLTMVHDAGASVREVAAYKRLIDQGKLKTRLYAMLSGPFETLKAEFAKGPVKDYGNRHLSVQAIKIVADGALGSRGAALVEPYADEPGNTGLLTTPPDEVYAQTLAAAQAGFQTGIHAIGDRANRQVLDAFERCSRGASGARSAAAQRARADSRCRRDSAVRPLNVIASMQADARDLGHAVGAGADRRRAHGRGRLRLAEAARSPASCSPTDPTSRSRSRIRCSGLYAADHAAGPVGQAAGRLDARRAPVSRRSAQVVHLERRLRRTRRAGAGIDRGGQIRRFDPDRS